VLRRIPGGARAKIMVVIRRVEIERATKTETKAARKIKIMMVGKKEKSQTQIS
jgi:hypothetical protein